MPKRATAIGFCQVESHSVADSRPVVQPCRRRHLWIRFWLQHLSAMQRLAPGNQIRGVRAERPGGIWPRMVHVPFEYETVSLGIVSVCVVLVDCPLTAI